MEQEVTSNENVSAASPVQREGGVRDVNQLENLDPLTNRTAQDEPGEKPETNVAESDAPNAPDKEGVVEPKAEPFALDPAPSHDMAGREMAAIAPKVDDGSRAAYEKLKAEAANETGEQSPKMGAQ